MLLCYLLKGTIFILFVLNIHNIFYFYMLSYYEVKLIMEIFEKFILNIEIL